MSCGAAVRLGVGRLGTGGTNPIKVLLVLLPTCISTAEFIVSERFHTLLVIKLSLFNVKDFIIEMYKASDLPA